MAREATETRLIRLPASAFTVVRAALASTTAAGAEATRQLGVEVGSQLARMIQDRGDDDLSSMASGHFWSTLEATLADMGWGSADHEQPHPGVVSLSSTDWFEADDQHSAYPSCQFTVGVLGELFRQVASLDVAVMEVECRAAGAECCRFLIGGSDALSSVFANLQHGDSYHAALASLA